MGILSRFRDIMASNMNAILNKADNPERTIDHYMKSLSSDLGKVNAETASVQMDERRAKNAWDDCQAEIKKLQRFAEKAVESGEDDDARKFLDKKAQLAKKGPQLQAAHAAAAANSVRMQQMQDKLTLDMRQLEARYMELKEKITATQVQQKLNAVDSGSGGANSAFGAVEEKVNQAYDEASALAELHAEGKDLDRLFAQLEKRNDTDGTADTDTATSLEGELAAIKAKLKKEQ